jgi:tetratricopeptide (TPR) repeat protein
MIHRIERESPMSNKKKKHSKSKSQTSMAPEIARWLNQAALQLTQGDYAGTLATTQRILSRGTPTRAQRVEALGHAGIAYSMLQQYDEAFSVLSQALTLTPNDAHIWYNRAMACRFTMRTGQSLRDFEHAINLEQDPALLERIAEELAFSRRMAEESRALRGLDFSLEQLIEQEELFQTGVRLMAAGKWEQTEQTFRKVIAMGDCLPQPWGNIGVCLIMQQRYDEAEIALRRAIDVDPNYTLARQNLAALPHIRQSGQLPETRITGPLDGKKIKQSITFVQER